MAAGELLVIECTDPLTMIDIPNLLRETGDKLEGSAKLKRLDFGAGQGDWKSTEWVADAVKISFSLVLKPKT